MDFTLSEEHRMIRDMARDFAQKEIAPIAAEHDETGEFPYETIMKMGAQGLMGIEVPEEYGGVEMDTLAYVVALEEISKVDASHGVVMSVNNSLYCHGLVKFGTEDQKHRLLAPVASGQVIGAYALTEPQSGSDAGNMRVTAELAEDGSHYVVNGTKSWITSGPVAKYIVIFAQTDPDVKPRYRGVTALVIDTQAPGFNQGKTEPKLGIRASATCEIHFEDYKCPLENRLGEEGEGFKIAMTVLDAGRIGIAAQAVGIAQAALDEALKYAKEREQFGRPIGKFQAIQWMLADMATETEAARHLVLKASHLKDTGAKYSLEAAMAKVYAAECASRCARKGLQVHGGYGYTKDYPIERIYRDARITEIYEGTSEVQRLVIANQLLK